MCVWCVCVCVCVWCVYVNIHKYIYIGGCGGRASAQHPSQLRALSHPGDIPNLRLHKEI